MAINLKGLREQAKLSQSQLAKILGISQSQVSRYEEAPDTVPYALLKQWCDALGTTPDQADQAESLATPVDPGDPYASLHARLDLLDEYCEAASSAAVPGAAGDAATSNPSVDELKALTRRLRRKPNVVLTGKYDSGKSRLANSVMGQDRLPTRLQPATRLITVVRHTDDRPAWMQGAAVREEVWILSKRFVLDDWENERNWTDSRVAIGGYDTLKDYGVHRERHAHVDAHYAVVFLDAPLLRACNVIDLPGRRNEREHADADAKRAEEAYPMIDVVIFLSPIAGFLDGFDMLDLSVLVRALPAYEAVDPDFPTLGNLFVVATHAAAHFSDPDVSTALDVACGRLMDHMGETAIAERAKDIKKAITKEDVRARFFGFLVEIEKRRKPFHDALRTCLTTHLPRAHQRAMNEQLRAFQARATGVFGQQVAAYRRMHEDIDRTRKEFEGLAAREPARKRRTEEAKLGVLRAIASLEERAVEGTSVIYATHAKVEEIERLIRQKYGGKRDAKAEAQQYAASHLVEVLQTAAARQAVRLSEELQVEVDAFLGQYELATRMPGEATMPVMEIPFDSKGAFLGGVAAAGTVGALALWSASLGNLGAYIIAAKAVSLLAVLGISIPGGTAAVMASIASIGGPITLAVGLGVVIAAVFSAIFGESWETRLAKKIEKSLHEAGMLPKMVAGTRKYWGDTRQAFLSGAAAVERDFADRVERLRAVVENPSRSQRELADQLRYAEAQYHFFAGIPIVPR